MRKSMAILIMVSVLACWASIAAAADHGVIDTLSARSMSRGKIGVIAPLADHGVIDH